MFVRVVARGFSGRTQDQDGQSRHAGMQLGHKCGSADSARVVP
jgi:hypothetical protein